MYNFFFQSTIVLSLGVIIYLLSRAVPRISDSHEINRAPNFFDQLIKKIPISRIDSALNLFFAKLLRKIKVLIMKTDNLINVGIHKLRKEDYNNGQNSLFSDLSDKDK